MGYGSLIMALSLYLSPRMADALVWLGRYQQRLETMGKETLLQFDAIIDRVPEAGKVLFAKLGSQLDYRCATEFLHEACYGQHSASLLSLSAQARENAIVIRDLLSDSLFGSVNSVYHALKAQENNASLDAYQLAQLLTEIEYFWGRISTRLVKNRAAQFILFGQSLEMIDLKLRLYGEVDTLFEDAHQLNLYGDQLSDNWQHFEPLNQNQSQNMNTLQASMNHIIRYDR
jgi:uncharacterized alpha-E superfamily protein